MKTKFKIEDNVDFYGYEGTITSIEIFQKGLKIYKVTYMYEGSVKVASLCDYEMNHSSKNKLGFTSKQ